MNELDQEGTPVTTQAILGIVVRRAPINYVGEKDKKAKPTLIEAKREAALKRKEQLLKGKP